MSVAGLFYIHRMYDGFGMVTQKETLDVSLEGLCVTFRSFTHHRR